MDGVGGMSAGPGAGEWPDDAKLLHLGRPWVAGARLAAGECLLSREPMPTRLIAESCPEPGCRCWICAPSTAELPQRHAAHRRRCHAMPGNGTLGGAR